MARWWIGASGEGGGAAILALRVSWPFTAQPRASLGTHLDPEEQALWKRAEGETHGDQFELGIQGGDDFREASEFELGIRSESLRGEDSIDDTANGGVDPLAVAEAKAGFRGVGRRERRLEPAACRIGRVAAAAVLAELIDSVVVGVGGHQSIRAGQSVRGGPGMVEACRHGPVVNLLRPLILKGDVVDAHIIHLSREVPS